MSEFHVITLLIQGCVIYNVSSLLSSADKVPYDMLIAIRINKRGNDRRTTLVHSPCQHTSLPLVLRIHLRRVLTISKENSPAMVPGLKDFLLQHDFGDLVLISPFDQVAQGQGFIGSTDDREVLDLLAKRLSCLWSPFRVVEGSVVLAPLRVEILHNRPGY